MSFVAAVPPPPPPAMVAPVEQSTAATAQPIIGPGLGGKPQERPKKKRSRRLTADQKRFNKRKRACEARRAKRRAGGVR